MTSRRQFLKTTACASAAAFWAEKTLFAKKNRPNILIFITDQVPQTSIGAYGNTYATTPNIDHLAKKGIRFSNAYTPCPLCQPARAAFWTSRYPHETNVRSNESSEHIASDMPTLGELFSAAGYECYHTGKTHDAGSLRGFTVEKRGEKERPHDEWSRYYNYDTNRDEYHAPQMIDFLKQDHDKPFLAVMDLYNPHNICNYCGVNAKHTDQKNLPDISDEQLPPLPDNFNVDDWQTRPLPIQYLCCTHPRLWQAALWNERNYRHYIAAFHHFLSLADEKIGLCLQALKDSGEYDNTLVVYFSDHGDGTASHRMVTKFLTFYEETNRVPFIFVGPGVRLSNYLVQNALVSLLDLLPTLCDYAGIDAPTTVRGKSLLPFFNESETHSLNRHFLVGEWHKEYNEVKRNPKYVEERKQCVSPGRMVRSERYKYMHYLEGNGKELYDLVNDPGEKINLAQNPDYAPILQQHRHWLDQHCTETNDDFKTLKVDVDPGFRHSHKAGFQHHYAPLKTGVSEDDEQGKV